MLRVLLATTNPAKQAKLRWVLDGLPVEPVPPPSSLAVPEDASTHRAVAEAKALAWSQRFGLPALASDGGLVIPALGERWQSLLTARAAGPMATDRARLDHLLDLMRPHEGPRRAAWWVEALAFAHDGRIAASWQAEGRPGLLAEDYRPESVVPGFWAFTIWVIPELGKRYGQLSPEEMERLEDHWGRLRQQVREWFAAQRQAAAEPP